VSVGKPWGRSVLERIKGVAAVTLSAFCFSTLGLFGRELAKNGFETPSILFYRFVLVGASKASFISTLEPIFALLLGLMLFSETLSRIQIAGATLIVASVAMAISPTYSKNSTSNTQAEVKNVD
jgi:hypothetical protein